MQFIRDSRGNRTGIRFFNANKLPVHYLVPFRQHDSFRTHETVWQLDNSRLPTTSCHLADLIIGQDEKEALRLAENFMAMIKGEASPEQIEELDEAGALQDISHMPARVKCAVLGWCTMSEMLQKGESSAQGSSPHCETK